MKKFVSKRSYNVLQIIRPLCLEANLRSTFLIIRSRFWANCVDDKPRWLIDLLLICVRSDADKVRVLSWDPERSRSIHVSFACGDASFFSLAAIKAARDVINLIRRVRFSALHVRLPGTSSCRSWPTLENTKMPCNNVCSDALWGWTCTLCEHNAEVANFKI